MLSGEERWKTTIPTAERWKTTICLSSKKATLLVQHTFFVHFFVVVLHDYNVKLPETSKLHQEPAPAWRKYCTCSRSFFFFSLPFIFTLHWWPVAFLIFSPPLQNCHVVLPTKRCLLFCLSLTLNLCHPWLFSLGFAGLPPSFFFVSIFLLLYFPNLWTWQLN